MNIVGFSGSTRPKGNTAYTVEKILEGAKASKTQIFCAGEIDIKPCQGCLGCVKSGHCVVNDGMQEIYDALKTADALVLGSPVYMGQMSAQAKAFTDRLFAFITPRFSPRFNEEHAGKKLVLAWTQGNPDSDKFRTYYDYTKYMFNLLEFDVQEVVVSGTRTSPASEQEGLDEKLKVVGALLSGG
jgi:multimeric flavodoxin WrbA